MTQCSECAKWGKVQYKPQNAHDYTAFVTQCQQLLQLVSAVPRNYSETVGKPICIEFTLNV